MPRLRTVTIDQRAVRRFQRRVKCHRAELAVHLDHFTDMIRELEADRRRINNAISALDHAMSCLRSADEYARGKG